jgi:hypothetical protein
MPLALASPIRRALILGLLAAPLAAQTAPNPASPQASAGPPATATPAPATPAAPAKKPVLVASETIHDAGRVRRGEPVEAVFRIENRGDADLVIKSVDPSCGCTVASFDKKLAPGASGEVRARVDTADYAGPITKAVTVLSNDPANPRLVLTIRADVQADVSMAPTYARLLQVQSLEPAKAEVRLWCDDGTPLEVRGVRSPETWIQAAARRAEGSEVDATRPQPQWIVSVTLGADAPLGPLGSSVEIDTNHPRQPKVELPLSGFVRPLLAAVPEVADWGTLPATAPKTRFVLKLFNFGKGEVTVKSATTDLKFVTVGVTPEDRGRRFRIQLDLAPDAPKGKFEGRLRIETSSPVVPVVEVPLIGRVG